MFDLQRVKHHVYNSVRVTEYLSQTILGNLIIGRKFSPEQKKEIPSTRVVLSDLKDLFLKDYENISKGLYRMPKAIVTNPFEFTRNSIKFFTDLVKVRDRQKRKAVQEFSGDIPKERYPKYFSQTFHFQTDGYMSDLSADLYDHQTELVFGGGTQAMRRQGLVPLRAAIDGWLAQGKALHDIELLDVACGTGKFLEEIGQNYPELRLTGLDLSPWYLKKARENLKDILHLNLIEANAEKMPLRDESFELATTVYLFHELPEEVRQKVARDIYRVLKKGGSWILVDSIQLGDKPEFDGSLRLFPENYHEPYFANFISQDLTKLFAEESFEIVSTERAFFSKIIHLKKLEKKKKAPRKKKSPATPGDPTQN